MSDSDAENPPLGETLATRRGFDGAWVHVRVDDVRLPTGRITTREVVEHPGSVAIVGVTTDGNVLLLRQSHHAIGRMLLGIPAGTLEPGETPEACARRELEEETGYRAGRLTELASYYTSPGYTNERMTIFHAADCEPAGGEIDPDELIRVTTAPLRDVARLLESGPAQLQDAKTLIGLLILLHQSG
ncbi:MAG: NUDIX hydrolase [Chloroflexi bacterium]|nr:NUDIX hydrolase [Chloroflexota bacterium]